MNVYSIIAFFAETKPFAIAWPFAFGSGIFSGACCAVLNVLMHLFAIALIVAIVLACAIVHQRDVLFMINSTLICQS